MTKQKTKKQDKYPSKVTKLDWVESFLITLFGVILIGLLIGVGIELFTAKLSEKNLEDRVEERLTDLELRHNERPLRINTSSGNWTRNESEPSIILEEPKLLEYNCYYSFHNWNPILDYVKGGQFKMINFPNYAPKSVTENDLK